MYMHVHVQDAAQSRHFYLCFFLCVCRLAGGKANGVVRYRGVPSFYSCGSCHIHFEKGDRKPWSRSWYCTYVIVLLCHSSHSFSFHGPDIWAELIFKMSKGNGDVQAALLKNRMEGMRVRDEFLCPVTCELFRWVLLAGALTPVLVHHPFHPLPCPAYCCLRSLTLPLWRREGSP